MQYRGYAAEIVLDEEAGILHGRVTGIGDVVTFESSTAAKLKKEFHASVDEYLRFCEELGREPDKPFSGRFLLRLSKEVHKSATLAAEREGVSLNAFINTAVLEKTQSEIGEFITRVNEPGHKAKR
ncbi:MAG: type II toxin-antitoxin system HicB family antitoxin [Bacteroidota bacterium]